MRPTRLPLFADECVAGFVDGRQRGRRGRRSRLQLLQLLLELLLGHRAGPLQQRGGALLELRKLLGRHKRVDDHVLKVQLPRELAHRMEEIFLLLLLLRLPTGRVEGEG